MKYYEQSDKKVIIKFKDKSNGKIITKFLRLRCKIGIYIYSDTALVVFCICGQASASLKFRQLQNVDSL